LAKVYIESLLEQLEGKEDHVYLDQAGLPTIGIGHLLTKDELSSGRIAIGSEFVVYRYGLIDKHIFDLLKQDIHKYQSVVKVMVVVDLNFNQETALTSFCYNIGMTAFNHSTMLKNLNNGDYAGVPYQMSRWTHAGGRVINGLKIRREKEIQVWNTPV